MSQDIDMIHLLMRAIQLQLIFSTLVLTLLFSCKKTDDFSSEPLSDYAPMQVGKYITYRLDSTVFPNFGRNTEVHYYQEKHMVDAQVPDAMGRPSYRVLKFLRDSGGLQSWQPAGSYFVTPLEKTVEVVENNLRFVRLSLPINEGFTWKTNQYLPDEPFLPLYSFQNDLDISDWDYVYASEGENFTLNGKTYSVITIDGTDRSSNVPVIDPSIYGSIDYQHYKYAKGLGLIYQEWIMWDYQPPNGMVTTGFKTGFGVKRSMIDHN